MTGRLICAGALAAVSASVGPDLGQDRPQPVIDMHMHALAADSQGPPPLAMCTPLTLPVWNPATPYPEVFLRALKAPDCDDPIWSPATDEELMQETLEVVARANVYGVLSGSPDRVAAWKAAAPGRFWGGLGFNVASGRYSVEDVRKLVAGGQLEVLAEITNQYAGVEPADPEMDPYWALAEELDVPVGIHVGTGPPGAAYLGTPAYRGRLHSALTLEEVLVRHPRLRLYVMHAGYPMIDDLLTLLYAHPQVHVEVGVIVFTQPRNAFYRYLRRIVEAGFIDRVMFGSDHMVWPEAIERSIAVIREAPFLSEAHERAILYDNAARFLRLTDAQIDAHQGR